jgi:hypothetical protein
LGLIAPFEHWFTCHPPSHNTIIRVAPALRKSRQTGMAATRTRAAGMYKTIPRTLDTCSRLSVVRNSEELKVAADGRERDVVCFSHIACRNDCYCRIPR